MGVRTTHLVMYGVSLTQDQANNLFEPNDEGSYFVPGCVELPYCVGAEDKAKSLIAVEDGMSGEYLVLGRIVDFANESHGESLDFIKFGDRETGKIKPPLTADEKRATVEALHDAGLSPELVNDNLTYMVFTHHS